MKILIVAELITRSGVGKYIQELSTELFNNGNEVFIATPFYDEHIVIDNNIKIYRLKSLRLKNYISIVHDINKICKKEKIEIIHSNHRNITFLLRFCNVFKHIPVIQTVHTSQYPNSRIKDFFSFWGDKTIACSSEVEEMLIKKHVKAERIIKIYNGVDSSSLNPPTAEEKEILKGKVGINGKIVFAVHGRIDYVKGIDLIVEALSTISKDILKKIVVVVSGDKQGQYYEQLVSAIKEKDLSDNFMFIGWNTSYQIFSISDAMLAPSRREGFPLSVIEAMFMKVPVFRTETGGFRDMKQYVYKIDYESVESIRNVILQFVENEDKYSQLINSAYNYATENCTIQQMTKNTLNVYNEIAKRKNV